MESTYSDPALLAYSDARTEYTKQLSQFIVPAVFKFFMNLLDKARTETGRETQKILFQFQTFLKEIPDWNMEKVSTEIANLERLIGCEYLEDLLTAVFIAHTKILTAIRISSKKNTNVQINVPKVERFLFKVICETSNLYWKNTYLFRDDVKNLEKQQNYRQAEILVIEGISMAIRALVPVKNILRECVINDTSADADSDDEQEAEEKPLSAKAPDSVEVAERPAEKPAEADAEAGIAVADVADHPVVKALLEAPASAIPTSASADATPVEAETTTSVSAHPVLTIDEHQSVDFADYDTVFDADNSNLIYDPKNTNLPSPDGQLTISDEPGTALDEFETIDDSAPASSALSSDDYETL